MLLFSQRHALEKLFIKWAEENGVAKTPLSVISFLQINELLDKDRAIEFLAKHEVVEKSVTPSGISWKDWEEFWA